MKVFLCVVAVALLSGCASKVASSSPRSVVISGPWDKVAEAQQLADAECAKYKRQARMVSKPRVGENQQLFDCVD